MEKHDIKYCLALLKKCLLQQCPFFSCNALNAIPLKCVSVNNQKYKTRLKIININSNEPIFYFYSSEVNKCSVSCNNVNNLYSKLCVPDFVKNKKCQSTQSNGMN